MRRREFVEAIREVKIGGGNRVLEAGRGERHVGVAGLQEGQAWRIKDQAIVVGVLSCLLKRLRGSFKCR